MFTRFALPSIIFGSDLSAIPAREVADGVLTLSPSFVVVAMR